MLGSFTAQGDVLMPAPAMLLPVVNTDLFIAGLRSQPNAPAANSTVEKATCPTDLLVISQGVWELLFEYFFSG